MKLRSVVFAAVPAMALSAGTVYWVTPAPRTALAEAHVAPSVTTVDLRGQGTDAPPLLGRFTGGETVKVDARLANAKVAIGQSTETFLLVEARGGEIAKDAVEPVAHLGIVIDRSGSMRGTRMQNAKAAANAAVDRLKDGDSVSVVTFDTRADVAVPRTTLSPTSRADVRREIEAISLGGDTCVSCGVDAEMDVLGAGNGETRRMIVLSDGDTNNGIRDEAGLRALAQRARDRGVTVTSIGVDLAYNERVMAALAEGGEGRHYFVQRPDDLAKVFSDEAEALRTSVASEASLSIELEPGVELVSVLDRSFERQGARIVVPMGSFSRGEVKTALLRVRITPARAEATHVARVDLRFQDLAARAPATVTGQLDAMGADTTDEADPFVMARVERSRTADALEEANKLFKNGDLEGARARLAAQRKVVSHFNDTLPTTTPNPFGRGDDAQKDSSAQLDSLTKADTGFASPPPPRPSNPSVAADSPFDASPQPAAQVRENQAAATESRR